MTKKISIMTLGCRVNQYESDAIAEKLESKGYKILPFDKGLDGYIINTCTVTAESDIKDRKLIRRARRYADETGGIVAVIGCFPQGADKKDYPLFDLCDYVSGNKNKMKIVDEIENLFEGKKVNAIEDIRFAEYEKMEISHCKHAKAYVKIEDGCNNFCSYCYVPYVRGRVRSRDKNDVLDEINRLCAKGYREIILTGIETASYGEDLPGGYGLVDLAEEIAEKTNIKRLRMGSLHPEFFTYDNCKRLSDVNIVMPHFHISVQSGSGNVLANMKRSYGERELYGSVSNIRKCFDRVCLSCDMICGFPGESEEDYKKSEEFVKNAKILHAHIFPYSIRKNTLAARMEGQIDDEIKKDRCKRLCEVAENVRREVLKENADKETRMLVENVKNGKAVGYSENYIYLKMPEIKGISVGDIVNVTPDITDMYEE